MIKNTFWLLLGEGLMKAFQYFINIMIARKIGVEDYGLFNEIFSFTQLFAVFADFGMSVVLVKELSKKEVSEKKALEENFLLKILLILVTFSSVAVLALFGEKSNNYLPYLALAGYNVLQFGYVPFVYAFTRYKEDFKFETFLKVGNLLFTGLAFLYFTNNPTVSTASLPYLITPILPSLVATYLLFKRNKFKLRINFPRKPLAQLSKYKSVFISSLTTTLLTVLPFQYIAMKSHYDLGLFSAAYRLVIPLTLIATIVNTSLLPKIETLLIKLRGKIVALSLISILVYGFFSYTLSPMIMDLLYGDSYSNAVNTLRVILVIPIFFFLNQFLQNILLTKGQEKEITLSALAGIATLLILFTLQGSTSLNLSLYIAVSVVIANTVICVYRIFRLRYLDK